MIRGMNWQEAKVEAVKILDGLGAPGEMKGITLGLVDFASEDDCRHFYSERSLGEHRLLNTAIARAVRERGGVVRRTVITPGMFGDSRLSPGDARQHAESYVYLLPRPAAV
jgi:hypothetical protein